MTGSVAPRLPDSGWKILWQKALDAFTKDESNLGTAGAVADWIVECRRDGPPANAIDCGDDRYLAPIPGTHVAAEYLVVVSEFLIIVREFR